MKQVQEELGSLLLPPAISSQAQKYRASLSPAQKLSHLWVATCTVLLAGRHTLFQDNISARIIHFWFHPDVYPNVNFVRCNGRRPERQWNGYASWDLHF